MTKYIVGVIVLIGVIAALICFKYFFKKEPEKEIKQENKNIIKQPAMYLLVGIMSMIIIAFLILLIVLNYFTVISISEKESIFYIPLFLPAIIAGIYIILLGSLWKIEIYEDSIMYRNLFGKKKIYKFDEVEIVPKSASLRVHFNGKKIINISYLQSNFDALQKTISNYKKLKREEKKQKAKK